MAELLQITEVFVIVTGTSNRHVRTLADEVDEQLKDRSDRDPLRVEGITESQWVLLDYGDVVLHVFQADTRAFYDLERLWADAPQVDWEPVRQEA